MCGIIGYISNKKESDAGQQIINQYQDQHGRGSKGFGLLTIDDNNIQIERATEPIKALLDVRFMTAPIGIFHHRFPTSTDNKMSQTHPIKVSHKELKYDYLVIHNGVIGNSDELFERHCKDLGYVYDTYEEEKYTESAGYRYKRDKFNDSESFAIEISRYLDKKSKEIGTRGSAAFIAVAIDKETNKAVSMTWGRNGFNPLEILETKSGILIASTIENVNAYSVTEDTYDSLDLVRLAKKRETTDIFSLIKSHKLKFNEFVPKTTAPVIIESKTTFSKNSRHSTYQQSKKETASATPTKKEDSTASETMNKTTDSTTPTHTDKEEFEIRTEGYPPRMKAFIKISDRIMRDLWPEVEAICLQMAYDEITEDEITGLVSNLQDILIEKEVLAKKRIRPYYDSKEDIEMAQWEEEKAIEEASIKHLQDEDKQREIEYELYSTGMINGVYPQSEPHKESPRYKRKDILPAVKDLKNI